MNSIQKSSLNRYHVLASFVLFSIVLFFIARQWAGSAYISNIDHDIIGQFTDAIDLAIRLLGIYLLILYVTAVSGLWISRAYRRNEFTKGFKFSIFYCGALTIFYLVILLTLK